MKFETPKIIVNDNYGNEIYHNEPSKKIITDYQAWCIEIEPIIPTAKGAWDFQANQIRYMESLIKDAAMTIKAQHKVIDELKVMYEQLVRDNYEMEMKLQNTEATPL
jgi:hypothetical protein